MTTALSGRLIQSLCRSSHEVIEIATPVERIDQGWHHQGLSDQKGG